MNSWRWNGRAFEVCFDVPLHDRGFRYGMSVFESFPVLAFEPQHFEAHLVRLRAACAQREFDFDEMAMAAAGGLLSEARVDGFARIYVTAGDGALTTPARECRVFVFIEPQARNAPSAYEVQLADDMFHPLFGGLKTANYWANIDALHRAQRRGKDEALLFNDRAELISACCANVFIVRGGVVRTPPPASGARRGVIRELVLQRITVEERSLFVGDALEADEIFLTNSWMGVMPVATVNGRALPSRTVAASLGALEQDRVSSLR